MSNYDKHNMENTSIVYKIYIKHGLTCISKLSKNCSQKKKTSLFNFLNDIG